MNLRSNKGFTGIDISVALVVIVLFVSLIATLVYNFGVTSKGVNRKSVATDIAITKIEEVKQANYDEILESTTSEYKDENGRDAATGPYEVTIKITPYSKSEYISGLSQEEKDNLKDVIKIVTVTVQYTVGTRTESVDISTVITKES